MDILGGGACPDPLRSIGNIMREPMLFARWQQRCGLAVGTAATCCILVTASSHVMQVPYLFFVNVFYH